MIDARASHIITVPRRVGTSARFAKRSEGGGALTRYGNDALIGAYRLALREARLLRATSAMYAQLIRLTRAACLVMGRDAPRVEEVGEC